MKSAFRKKCEFPVRREAGHMRGGDEGSVLSVLSAGAQGCVCSVDTICIEENFLVVYR